MNLTADSLFKQLYDVPKTAMARYLDALAKFERQFGAKRGIVFISAPGRTEICGNHTDHQRGLVLAASVNLDLICIAAPKCDNSINIISEGYEPNTISLDSLHPNSSDKGSIALIRGIAAYFKKNGYSVGGFDAYMTSQVPGGSGLSSSAAFEIAVGNVFNHLYNNGSINAERLALAGQYAENVYLNKPSGLLDQMTSSVGGFVKINFANSEKPVVTPLKFNLEAAGFSLCVVDTKGNHADLTADYACIPAEMRMVAKYFGKQYLSEIDETEFEYEMPKIRVITGDRAVLRAMHFFAENKRVEKQAAALIAGDIKKFLELVIESGDSSFMCLQNIYADPKKQGLSIALEISKRILGSGGAWRVHGGGFAGTIQAYVSHEKLPEYRAAIERVFGDGSCLVLKIREIGGVRLWQN